MASHVSQCMAKACMSDTWQAMCVTHGMPCVNMHGPFEAYIRGFTWAVHTSKESSISVLGGAARRRRRKGGKEKRKGGKERRKGGKEKERKEEKRGKKRKGRGGKERGKRRSVAQ